MTLNRKVKFHGFAEDCAEFSVLLEVLRFKDAKTSLTINAKKDASLKLGINEDEKVILHFSCFITFSLLEYDIKQEGKVS